MKEKAFFFMVLERVFAVHGNLCYLFLSSYQAGNDEHSGGYWKQWFDRTDIGEENRLAYVAFSRARYLLALGIPKPKSFSETDRKILEDTGFKIVES